MSYYIAVFKSRSATLNFAKLLKMNNIPCAIINTPSSIGYACGISVKFLSDYFFKVKELLSRQVSTSFDGVFTLDGKGAVRIF